jgi:hypothetical protein
VADEQIKAALMKYNDWAEGITFAGAIKAFRSLASPAQAAAVPAHSEIYAALRQAGLSLVKTVRGLHVVKLIEGEAQATTTGLAWNPEFLSPVEAYEQGRFDEQAAQGPNPYPDDGAVSQAAAVPEAVERDAARYRQLRRGQQWSVIDGIGDALRGEVLDAAIDRAALSQGDVSGEGEGA